MTKVQTKMVPLSALEADEINVRKAGSDLTSLKATLLARGPVQSLRVRPGSAKGMFKVPAGGRRFRALCELRDEGKIGNDYEVPVIIADDDDATALDISIMENIERQPLSIVDEIRAWGDLASQGSTAGEIALRHGVSERRVQQRLRLAELHADVIAALDEGVINLEAAQAFTVEPDAERQAAYLAKHRKDQPWMLSARNVRQAFTTEHVRADSAIAGLIGEKAYAKAGGVVMSDLFQEERYWTSRDVVDQLLDAHWQKQTAKWLKEGWAWAAPRDEYGEAAYSLRRVYPEPVAWAEADKARFDEIEAQLEALYEGDDGDWSDEDQAKADAMEAEQTELNERYTERAFTAEQMSYCGVIYDREGRAPLFGIIDPEKTEVPAEIAAPVAENKPKVQSDDPANISAALSLDLSLMLSASARRHVEADPDMALSLLAATLYRSLAHRRSASHVTAIAASGVDRQFEDEAFAAAFERYRAMTPKSRAKALASLFAATVDVSDSFTGYSGSREARADLLAIVQPDPTPDFDAERYFAGVNKAQIQAAYVEMTGGKLNDGKKGDMAKAAAAKALETGWLPVQLRTAAYQPAIAKAA